MKTTKLTRMKMMRRSINVRFAMSTTKLSRELDNISVRNIRRKLLSKMLMKLKKK
jgi:hypothetical protein